MLLTQSTTPIIGWIATLLGYVMNFIFTALSSVGIQNIGLCIIIFTIFVRLLMIPLTIKQQKSMKINQIMQPEIQKIQKKYRNKKDQASMVKQNEEIKAVYEKYGTNMTGGCAQILVQFPVFLALFQVIRRIPAYIPDVKTSYLSIVNAIDGTSGYIDKINTIADGLNSSYVSTLADDATSNQVIDVLTYFKTSTWNELADAFPAAADTIHSVSQQIIGVNNFVFDINIAQAPGLHLSIYLLLPILAALFQYLSATTMQQPNTSSNPNDPTASMNKSMKIMMPIMSLYFCIIMPAGMGIYWVTSAAFQCLQQIVVNKYMEHADVDKLIEKNKEKAAKKKAKGKKSLMDRLTATSEKAEAAKENLNRPAMSIKDIASINTKKIQGPEGVGSGTKDYRGTLNVDLDSLGEIGRNAYLLMREQENENSGGGKK